MATKRPRAGCKAPYSTEGCSSSPPQNGYLMAGVLIKSETLGHEKFEHMIGALLASEGVVQFDNNLVYAGQIGTAEQIDFSALDIHQEGIGTKMSDLVFKAEGRNANPTYGVGIVSQIQARREEV